MKIVKYIFFLFIIFFMIGFLIFFILTFIGEFNFENIYININKKYLYVLISSALLISTATFMAQETLSNRMIDASFMGMGPLASFVAIILLSIFAGQYFQRTSDNWIINLLLPIASGTFISLVGVAIMWMAKIKKLSKKELIILLIVVNSLLSVISQIYMNKQSLTNKEFISAFIVSSIRQITFNRFLISIFIWIFCFMFYILFLRKKTRVMKTCGDNFAKSLGIKIHRVRIMNLIFVGIMLGYAAVIAGNLAFLGIISIYLSGIFTKKGSIKNLIFSNIVALIINLLTYAVFESWLEKLNILPFGAIISVIGGAIFIISNVFNGMRIKKWK